MSTKLEQVGRSLVTEQFASASPLPPLVSICIPTYNRAAKLAYCVESMLACDYPNIEIIISDNGSPDETPSVCAALQARDKRISFHRHPCNLGPAKNFEFVRSRANGTYFMWHGDDDYLDRNFISKCIAELERDRTLVLAGGVAAYHRGDHEIISYGRAIELCSDYPFCRIVKYLWQVTDNSIFCGVYRRHAVSECGTQNILAGDWAWIAAVASIGKTKLIPDVFVYRESGDTLSSSSDGFKRLVTVCGLPSWNAVFPWLGIAIGVTNYIVRHPTSFARRPLLVRVFWGAAVFIVLLAKRGRQILSRLILKLPFVTRLYYGYRRRARPDIALRSRPVEKPREARS